jgi:hypothetical protein
MPRTATALAVTAALTTAAAAITGCSTAAKPLTAAQATRQRAEQASHALDLPRAQPATPQTVPVLQLGILATPADTTGLAAAGLGTIAAKLSPSGIQLKITTYTSSAAETAALAAGRLDAAYTTPAAAIATWQYHHAAICVIAGATQTASGTPAVVLAASSTWISAHPAAVTGLLEGDIQAVLQLLTTPATAIPVARTELQAIQSSKITHAQFLAFSRYRATGNPGAEPAGVANLSAARALLAASGLPGPA